MKQNAIVVGAGVFLVVFVLWPQDNPQQIPPKTAIFDPQATSEDSSGQVYVWEPDGLRGQIKTLQDENASLKIRLAALEVEAGQKDGGLKALSAEVDTLREESAQCEGEVMYWSGRVESLMAIVDGAGRTDGTFSISTERKD